jgi:FkbM family methyltransferase
MIIFVTGSIPGKGDEQQIAILRDDTHLSRWIENSHRLDADDSVLLAKIMPLIPAGSVVVDAGASLGDHAALYSTRARMVHAFEPNPEPCECLRRNCAGLRVRVYQSGLSDADKELRLFRYLNVGACTISDIGDVPIHVNPLDDYGLSPALMKIDVEGHEVRVLRGARETILDCRPILIIEVNKWQLEPAGYTICGLYKELEDLGYRHCTDIRTDQPFDPDDGRGYYDILGRPD